MKKISILLADDHPLVREGIRSLLANQTDMVIVGEATDGNAAVRLAEELAPDVVFMDLSMPGMSGTDATRRIRAAFPRIKVIALSMHGGRRDVLDALAAGASGYVVKDSAGDELVRAVRSVLASDAVYLNSQLQELTVPERADGPSETEGREPSFLTPREREVLALIVSGKNTQAVADQLGISIKTAEYHRTRIMKKMRAGNLAELTKLAIREGIALL